MLKFVIAAAVILAATAAQAQTPKSLEVSPGCRSVGETILKMCGRPRRDAGPAQAACFQKYSQPTAACPVESHADLEKRKALARKEGQEWRATGKLPH